jgi:hypothetical protein
MVACSMSMAGRPDVDRREHAERGERDCQHDQVRGEPRPVSARPRNRRRNSAIMLRRLQRSASQPAGSENTPKTRGIGANQIDSCQCRPAGRGRRQELAFFDDHLILFVSRTSDAVTDAAIGLPELADNPVFASLRLARLYGRPQADRLTDFELARCHALASRAVRHLGQKKVPPSGIGPRGMPAPPYTTSLGLSASITRAWIW